MELIVNIFSGLLLITLGVAVIKYRRTIKSWTGNFVWAEKHIGNGGTYFVLMVFGLGLIFVGTLYPFGGVEVLFKK